MAAHDDPGDLPVDPLLGQPQMVADPRISVAQAADVLGKTKAHVYWLTDTGRLRRHGAPNTRYGLLLSEVLALHDKGNPSNSTKPHDGWDVPSKPPANSLPTAT